MSNNGHAVIERAKIIKLTGKQPTLEATGQTFDQVKKEREAEVVACG